MADNLNMTFGQRVADDDICLAPDPRMLLASIVHDFNIFLTPIMSVLEEMQGRGAGTARQLKRIDGAIYCAFRAKTLARQLVDFASPQPAKLAAVDVGSLLRRLEAPLASLLSGRIRLDLDIAETLPKAFIDQQLIDRVLFNLVLNARDAMPEGGRVTIAVAPDRYPAGPVRGGNSMIRLTVADTGSGMDEATLEMAGEPHFSTKTNGTGLGLATVRQVMERQGGGLSIASAPHRGTTVDLWLPVM
ncbi:sensor histidine kinase [Mesorhizobium neociceri]|uniref:histidine kinase n=1 Tax=Mesorhizobium neociceri TaxID=1307853 RepID=A0A838AYC0_9HYPH|nr:HAMP domain-containing sensor histidine kinase [Mesorhizobium neociceri]MBA1138654.1 HAMP domain-containing histidine kinase [Mesorhizobium neociceri]